ncbi:TPA: hypothetical protein ACTXXA_003504 [Legionella anisa]
MKNIGNTNKRQLEPYTTYPSVLEITKYQKVVDVNENTLLSLFGKIKEFRDRIILLLDINSFSAMLRTSKTIQEGIYEWMNTVTINYNGLFRDNIQFKVPKHSLPPSASTSSMLTQLERLSIHDKIESSNLLKKVIYERLFLALPQIVGDRNLSESAILMRLGNKGFHRIETLTGHEIKYRANFYFIILESDPQDHESSTPSLKPIGTITFEIKGNYKESEKDLFRNLIVMNDKREQFAKNSLKSKISHGKGVSASVLEFLGISSPDKITKECIDNAMEKAKLTRDNIHDCVLKGENPDAIFIQLSKIDSLRGVFEEIKEKTPGGIMHQPINQILPQVHPKEEDNSEEISLERRGHRL